MTKIRADDTFLLTLCEKIHELSACSSECNFVAEIEFYSSKTPPQRKTRHKSLKHLHSEYGQVIRVY